MTLPSAGSPVPQFVVGMAPCVYDRPRIVPLWPTLTIGQTWTLTLLGEVDLSGYCPKKQLMVGPRCAILAITRRAQMVQRAVSRAEERMAVFLIANVKITDESWIPNYAAKVHDIAAKHGGKYLSRSGNVRAIEGEPPDTSLIALIQFPSMEAVEAFVRDPDYAPFAKSRQAGSISRFYAIDDTDLAGSIPYLPAGR